MVRSGRQVAFGVVLATLAFVSPACGYPSEIAPFCEEAVAVFDRRTPIRPELENLRRLAIEYLPTETAEPLVVELDSLWDALQGGSTEGYWTNSVTELIADVCGVETGGVASGPPLIMEGPDTTSAKGR